MSQPRPHGLSSITGYPNHPLNHQVIGHQPPTSNPSQPDHDDPFTGPLLKRWADQQRQRLERAEPDLDLWSGIEKRLKP